MSSPKSPRTQPLTMLTAKPEAQADFSFLNSLITARELFEDPVETPQTDADPMSLYRAIEERAKHDARMLKVSNSPNDRNPTGNHDPGTSKNDTSPVATRSIVKEASSSIVPSTKPASEMEEVALPAAALPTKPASVQAVRRKVQKKNDVSDVTKPPPKFHWDQPKSESTDKATSWVWRKQPAKPVTAASKTTPVSRATTGSVEKESSPKTDVKTRSPKKSGSPANKETCVEGGSCEEPCSLLEKPAVENNEKATVVPHEDCTDSGQWTVEEHNKEAENRTNEVIGLPPESDFSSRIENTPPCDVTPPDESSAAIPKKSRSTSAPGARGKKKSPSQASASTKNEAAVSHAAKQRAQSLEKKRARWQSPNAKDAKKSIRSSTSPKAPRAPRVSLLPKWALLKAEKAGKRDKTNANTDSVDSLSGCEEKSSKHKDEADDKASDIAQIAAENKDPNDISPVIDKLNAADDDSSEIIGVLKPAVIAYAEKSQAQVNSQTMKALSCEIGSVQQFFSGLGRSNSDSKSVMPSSDNLTFSVRTGQIKPLCPPTNRPFDDRSAITTDQDSASEFSPEQANSDALRKYNSETSKSTNSSFDDDNRTSFPNPEFCKGEKISSKVLVAPASGIMAATRCGEQQYSIVVCQSKSVEKRSIDVKTNDSQDQSRGTDGEGYSRTNADSRQNPSTAPNGSASFNVLPKPNPAPQDENEKCAQQPQRSVSPASGKESISTAGVSPSQNAQLNSDVNEPRVVLQRDADVTSCSQSNVEHEGEKLLTSEPVENDQRENVQKNFDCDGGITYSIVKKKTLVVRCNGVSDQFYAEYDASTLSGSQNGEHSSESQTKIAALDSAQELRYREEYRENANKCEDKCEEYAKNTEEKVNPTKSTSFTTFPRSANTAAIQTDIVRIPRARKTFGTQTDPLQRKRLDEISTQREDLTVKISATVRQKSERPAATNSVSFCHQKFERMKKIPRNCIFLVDNRSDPNTLTSRAVSVADVHRRQQRRRSCSPRMILDRRDRVERDCQISDSDASISDIQDPPTIDRHFVSNVYGVQLTDRTLRPRNPAAGLLLQNSQCFDDVMPTMVFSNGAAGYGNFDDLHGAEEMRRIHRSVDGGARSRRIESNTSRGSRAGSPPKSDFIEPWWTIVPPSPEQALKDAKFIAKLQVKQASAQLTTKPNDRQLPTIGESSKETGEGNGRVSRNVGFVAARGSMKVRLEGNLGRLLEEEELAIKGRLVEIAMDKAANVSGGSANGPRSNLEREFCKLEASQNESSSKHFASINSGVSMVGGRYQEHGPVSDPQIQFQPPTAWAPADLQERIWKNRKVVRPVVIPK